MRALTWQGRRDVRVEDVPDPRVTEPTDAVIRVTSTAICGSDLHLYEVLGMFLRPGDILGHEPMGVVEEVGAEVANLRPGDRVVVPFTISCGHCWMCDRALYAQCETTQVRDTGKGAALFGYTSLYGAVPGGQAEYLRVPQAQFGPVKLPPGPPDERFLYLSDILPTAWQAVAYADVPDGGTLAVLGLGPVGQMCVRLARHVGAGGIRATTPREVRVIGVDRVRARMDLAARHGADVLDVDDPGDIAARLFGLTDGRGPDAVIDAVGMEAHGAPLGKAAQAAVGLLPDSLARPLAQRYGLDRMAALHTAIRAVRRGGTVSLSGVYGGEVDPMPMMDLFDKGVQLRMGQAHVRRWTDQILPLLTDADVLGVETFATHRLPLADAPHGYEIFQKKLEDCVKVVLTP
ncbi:zinc-dependent alcohol dehydrogenase [Frankia canadensis]